MHLITRPIHAMHSLPFPPNFQSLTSRWLGFLINLSGIDNARTRAIQVFMAIQIVFGMSHVPVGVIRGVAAVYTAGLAIALGVWY